MRYLGGAPAGTDNWSGVFSNDTWSQATWYTVGCINIRTGYHEPHQASSVTLIMNGAWRYGIIPSGVFCVDTWPPTYQFDVGCLRTDYHSCTDNYIWNGFGGDWAWSPSGIAGAFSTNDYGPQYITIHLGCRDLRTGYHRRDNSAQYRTIDTLASSGWWTTNITWDGVFYTDDHPLGAVWIYIGCRLALRTEGIIIGR